MKDAVATMGDILPDDAGGRDAVHVAVVSARAVQRLRPGDDVGFPGADNEEASGTATLVGIVDPFLKAPVKPGQRFWLYLYPRTITGLCHHWTHPAFPDDPKTGKYNTPSQKLVAENRLREICGGWDGPDYDTFIATCRDGRANSGDDDYYSCSISDGVFYCGGFDAHGDIPQEVWPLVEIVLGKQMDKRPEYFSCSC